MKVAVVSPMKSYGGIERTFVSLANEFSRRGISTTFAMLRDSETPYPEELGPGTTVRNLGTRSKRDGISKIAEFVRVESPDAIVTAKDHGAQVALLSRLLYRWDAPIVVTVTNMWSHVIRRPVQRLFVRWLYPKADGIITVSSGVKADLCETFGLPPSRVRVIFNPVMVEHQGGANAESSLHPWLDETRRVPLILAIGRLEPQKDFTTLVRAFSRLRGDRPCRLMILGEGSRRTELESLARELEVADDVALTGQVNSALPYLRSASLFVLSSQWEGFGIVLAEALAMGVPVVATDCPSGPAEILENGRYGLLVPVGDADALAAAMRRTLDAPPDREDLIRAAERFAPSGVADAYVDCMQRAIAQRSE